MRWRESTEDERKEREARLAEQGRRLRDLRKSEGLTKKELADKLRVHEGLVKLIESGRRDLTEKNLEKCAEIFGARKEYIAGYADYPDRAAELLAELPEGDRVRMEGVTAVWRATEQWIRAAFPGESLEELEAQGKINLFEIFCGVTECVQDAILKAKLPADLRERVEKKELDLCEITCDPDQK